MVLMLNPPQKTPGFSERLGSSIEGGLMKGAEKGIDFAQQIQMQRMKEGGKNQFLSQLLGSSGGGGSLSPQAEAALALSDPQAYNAYKALKESRSQEQELVHQKALAKKAIIDIENEIKKGTNILGLGNLTTKGRGIKGSIDTAALNLEKLAVEMVGKGTLSKERFNYLKERLPSSNKTDAKNRAILKEWRKIIGESESGEPIEEKPPLSSFYE